MDDEDGPYAATRFYKKMFQGETIDIDSVPYALDDAVSFNRWPLCACEVFRPSGGPPSSTWVHEEPACRIVLNILCHLAFCAI
jgi:hypothetical protein